MSAIVLHIAQTERTFATGSLSIALKLGARTTCDFIANSDGSWRPVVGQVVEVWDITGTKMFAGTIDEVTESSLVPEIPTLTHSLNVRCTGWEQYLDRRVLYNTSAATVPVYGRNFVVTVSGSTLTSATPHGRSAGDSVRLKVSSGGACRLRCLRTPPTSLPVPPAPRCSLRPPRAARPSPSRLPARARLS
jgi:hypothetical protein